MKIEKLTPNQVAENIILGKYIYNSDEYGEAVNRIGYLNNLNQPIEIVKKMANSDDFCVLCAFAFIISETHSRDLLPIHNELKPIIRQVLAKNCYRANFDLIDTFAFFIENNLADTNDYLVYLNLINSDNYIIQFISISNLLNFNDVILQELNQLSDFNIAMELPNLIDKEWFNSITQGKSLSEILIALTLIYRFYGDKALILELYDKQNPYLFDFVNIYLFR
ncbi:hypothetical protein [Mannheimia indoligenes]|uniref:hypothetical protein n=1 Tax=Mannheimia indoligenes TaxID=3103145 RepID=UPI002FE5AC00